MPLRYMTAGESHGPFLTAILEGLPAGVPITEAEINEEMSRRQHMFGRGERQQYIEKDAAKIVSGVRFGETLGSPITVTVENKDWVNWEKIMSIEKKDFDEKYALVRPRPGHADLTGVIKFNRRDTRDILERASARETAARTAVGTICRRFLSVFGIEIYGWVTQIAEVKAAIPGGEPKDIYGKTQESPVQCPDEDATKKMMDVIQTAKRKGDTLGGIYEIVITGVPMGLGTHIQWDRKLDAQLAQALMSIQAHKGVEVGEGFRMGTVKGSEVHDEIFYDKKKGFYRKTNNAGGFEGGMTNGMPLVLRSVIKPLASLRRPLNSVHINTKEDLKAEIVRSDTAPVASACIIGQAVVATTVANAFLEKFGGDSLKETKDNFDRYIEHIRSY